MVFQVSVLAGFGGKLGVEVLKLLGGDEADLPAETHGQLRVENLDAREGVADRLNNACDRLLEVVDRAGFGRDDLFPVPLVDVNGVQVIHFFITADGVHIGIKALARLKAVFVKGEPLPFGERVDDLCLRPGFENIKRDGAFNAVEVVVDAGRGIDEQRRGNPLESQRFRELLLKVCLSWPMAIWVSYTERVDL